MSAPRLARYAATVVAAAMFTVVAASEGKPPKDSPVPDDSEIVLPVLVRKVEPNYPVRLRHEAEQGVVTLEAVINVDGTVGDIKVVSSSHEEFSKAAVDAVKRWRYKPARQHGEPVPVHYTVVVKFSLRGVLTSRRIGIPSEQECHGDGGRVPWEDLDTPPRVVQEEHVVLPRRLEDVGGRVEVEFEICRDGRVRTVRILNASDPGLGQAVWNAAREWRFESPTKAGTPVAATHRAVLTIRPDRP